MLETFKIAFAAGLGLIAAIVSFALLLGLWETLSSSVTLARWRRKIKS